MNTIFLDIDGVLYGVGDSDLLYSMASKDKLDMLYKFHKENACHIVITSTRRMYEYERLDIEEVFKGFNYSYLDYNVRLIDRATEIESYINETKTKHYCILDDNDLGYSLKPSIMNHFIQVDYLWGLREEDLLKAKNILNN